MIGSQKQLTIIWTPVVLHIHREAPIKKHAKLLTLSGIFRGELGTYLPPLIPDTFKPLYYHENLRFRFGNGRQVFRAVPCNE